MIRPWDPERDMPTLGAWLRARGQAETAGWRELYPQTGLVADEIAIGFLYKTDAPHVGWLDGVVTDPYATKDERAKALAELIPALYAEADKQGLRLVFATTSAPSLIQLGHACGARTLQREHVCLARTKE